MEPEEFGERAAMSDEQEPLNRRDVLVKAAAAGTIAWSSPLIVSSTVSAQAACTPTCAPPNNQFPSVQPTVRRECQGTTRNYFWESATYFASVIGCPCGGFVTYEFVGPDSSVVIFSQSGPGNLFTTVPIVFRIACESNGGEVYRECSYVGALNYFDGDETCTDTQIAIPSSFSAPCGNGVGCG